MGNIIQYQLVAAANLADVNKMVNELLNNKNQFWQPHGAAILTISGVGSIKYFAQTMVRYDQSQHL